MTSGIHSYKRVQVYIALWFIIWAVVFEFFIPVNKFLPAPSVLIRSFGALWTDYHLGVNLLSSISVIYVSLALSFFMIRYLRNLFFRGRGLLFNILLSLEWFAEFVPGIIIGILLIFWFPGSDYTEFVFVFLLCFASLSISLFKLRGNINRSYWEAAASLGLKGRDLSRVEFNSVLPQLADELDKLHFYAWTLLIIFEFINRAYGMGAVLRNTFEFQDLSAFTATMVVTGVLIYAGDRLLNYLKEKFVYWN